MSKSVRDMLTYEARELIDAYERCKWLESLQPDSDSTSAAKEHLESLANGVHYAFWNNKRRIRLVESLTAEVARLRGVIENCIRYGEQSEISSSLALVSILNTLRGLLALSPKPVESQGGGE